VSPTWNAVCIALGTLLDVSIGNSAEMAAGLGIGACCRPSPAPCLSLCTCQSLLVTVGRLIVTVRDLGCSRAFCVFPVFPCNAAVVASAVHAALDFPQVLLCVQVHCAISCIHSWSQQLQQKTAQTEHRYAGMVLAAISYVTRLCHVVCGLVQHDSQQVVACLRGGCSLEVCNHLPHAPKL
jgi:hypothetical protein